MPLKLNQKEKKCVKEWLKATNETKIDCCPFYEYSDSDDKELFEQIKDAQDFCGYPPFRVCASWFPKINDNHCPCYVYSLEHVKKTARKMIYERRENGKSATKRK